MTSLQDLTLSVISFREVNSLWYPLCWWKAKQHLLTCSMRAPDVREPGSEPHAPCCKSDTAVQSTSPLLPNKLFMTLASYNKITLHTVMTWPPVTTICFKIWNPIFALSAMHDNVWFKAVCVDAATRFHLTVYDIINYSDVTSAINSYVFVGNVHFTDI